MLYAFVAIGATSSAFVAIMLLRKARQSRQIFYFHEEG